MKKYISCLLFYTTFFADVEKVELQLNKPIIRKDSTECEEGGVIKTEDITIYAKNFSYSSNKNHHTVEATENLLIKFGRYFIIGDSIKYDFNERRGVIQNGVGTVNNIISGGKTINIYEDGSLEIHKAFATPSPTYPPVFEITSPLITVDKKTKGVAKTMVGWINGVPFLWLPSFGMVLDSKYKTAKSIDYNFTVENKQVPMIMGRYKMYDDSLLQAFFRLEYRFLSLDNRVKNPRWYDGLGSSIDLDYKSENKKVSFQSRNFVTYNIWPLDIDPNRVALRYRIQGRYKGESEDDSIESLIQWDKLSDRFLRTDFKTNFYDLKTLERNEAYIKYRIDPIYISLYGRPRLNEYRGFKQELPSFNIAPLPLEVFNSSKLYLEQRYNLSNLRYLYAEELRGAVADFNSGRFSSTLNLYRPFQFSILNFTPRVGFDGIFYTNNQKTQTTWQGVCSYGGDANIELYADYKSFSHYIKPYAKYDGLTSPTSNNDNHYIFGIEDGYANYNQLLFGLNNEIYLNNFSIDMPTCALNIGGMKFFNTKSFIEPLSKGDIELAFNYPTVELSGKFGWNFEKNVYDFIHVHYGWTINDYIALSTEFRDRGKYWWRKDNHKNFILDSYRTIDALKETPLSDARYCFVNKLQVQIAPLWTLQVENNLGKRNELFNEQGDLIRAAAPYYTQTKFNLSMILSNSYRLSVSCTLTNSVKENVYSFSFDTL